jgi:hypothetical protein
MHLKFSFTLPLIHTCRASFLLLKLPDIENLIGSYSLDPGQWERTRKNSTPAQGLETMARRTEGIVRAAVWCGERVWLIRGRVVRVLGSPSSISNSGEVGVASTSTPVSVRTLAATMSM